MRITQSHSPASRRVYIATNSMQVTTVSAVWSGLVWSTRSDAAPPADASGLCWVGNVMSRHQGANLHRFDLRLTPRLTHRLMALAWQRPVHRPSGFALTGGSKPNRTAHLNQYTKTSCYSRQIALPPLFGLNPVSFQWRLLSPATADGNVPPECTALWMALTSFWCMAKGAPTLAH